ncbi:hypothetical protein IEU95_04775 [Hoyosella rhizosphaerae]|uniref:Uncharacterized protein n=1 Tax=Hoyosella rhizosphaerae TaxID=1755582 RepID=A0A916U9K6_9ACTN|nr:hypothetical protein [Hoyosella rhizosphaerae]MBN4926131.1 hypothetical protein [Hoyosella rhizosphaerae]GGC65344.1 hypothetical protein GCM10011410_17270 [Hoyosella rhizosphaerae]
MKPHNQGHVPSATYGQPGQPGGWSPYGQSQAAAPRPPRPNPFAGIPISDFVRDGAAFALLLIALALPWGFEVSKNSADFRIVTGETVNGGGSILIILITLLSLTSLALPYAARIGMLGSTAGPSLVRLGRLVLNAPYALLIVGYLVYDIVLGFSRHQDGSTTILSGETGPGLGAAAWIGVAGAVLAAQPRAAELRDQSAPLVVVRWLVAIKVLAVSAFVLATVSVLSTIFWVITNYGASDSKLPTLSVLGLQGVLTAAIAGLIAVGLFRDRQAWSGTLVAFGGAVLFTAVFLPLLSVDPDRLSRVNGDRADALNRRMLVWGVPVESFYAVGAGFLALVVLSAAATAATIPNGLPASIQRHTQGRPLGYGWLTAARNIYGLIFVWSAGAAIVPILVLIMRNSLYSEFFTRDFAKPGELIAIAVLFGVTAALAFAGSFTLRFGAQHGADPRPNREVGLGVSALLTIFMIVWLIVATATAKGAMGYYMGTQGTARIQLIMLGLAIAPALILIVPKSVRELYADQKLFANLGAGGSGAVSGWDTPANPWDQQGQNSQPAHSFTQEMAADPNASPQLLADIANSAPELRPVIALNPAAIPEMIEWLGKLGDPAIDDALKQR